MFLQIYLLDLQGKHISHAMNDCVCSQSQVESHRPGRQHSRFRGTPHSRCMDNNCTVIMQDTSTTLRCNCGITIIIITIRSARALASIHDMIHHRARASLERTHTHSNPGKFKSHASARGSETTRISHTRRRCSVHTWRVRA